MPITPYDLARQNPRRLVISLLRKLLDRLSYLVRFDVQLERHESTPRQSSVTFKPEAGPASSLDPGPGFRGEVSLARHEHDLLELDHT